MSNNKRIAALLVTLCMVMLLLPSTAFADSTAPTIRTIEFVDGGHSTVYVNEVTSSGNGSDSIKYIYSSNIINAKEVLDGLKAILDDSYDALIPSPTNVVGIATSTSVDTPTADWASAEYVAKNIISGNGTVTSNSNIIDVSAARMATDLTSLKTWLEAENKAAWEATEKENEAKWKAEHIKEPTLEYVPSVYVPLKLDSTTLGTVPTLENNQYFAPVGVFISGPYYKYESGVLTESYDANIVCHTVTVLSQSSNKAIPFDSISLLLSTIENEGETDYVLRDGIKAGFAPYSNVTPGKLDDPNNPGVKIDYINPMKKTDFWTPTDHLESGYTKLIECNIQFPLTGYTEATLTGELTIPLPSGFDGASAKIVGGAMASSFTASTVTFPVTLNVTENSATLSLMIEFRPPVQSAQSGSLITYTHEDWLRDNQYDEMSPSSGLKPDKAAPAQELFPAAPAPIESAPVTAVETTPPQTADEVSTIGYIMLAIAILGLAIKRKQRN